MNKQNPLGADRLIIGVCARHGEKMHTTHTLTSDQIADWHEHQTTAYPAPYLHYTRRPNGELVTLTHTTTSDTTPDGRATITHTWTDPTGQVYASTRTQRDTRTHETPQAHKEKDPWE